MRNPTTPCRWRQLVAIVLVLGISNNKNCAEAFSNPIGNSNGHQMVAFGKQNNLPKRLGNPRATAPSNTALQGIPGVGFVTRTIGSGVAKFFTSLFREKVVLSHILLAFVVGSYYGKGRLPFARYKQAGDIPGNQFSTTKGAVLGGHAVRVSDGDTIRFLHAPTMFHPKALAKKQKSSTNALAVRICTIDTPETAKFGKPGQPFGPEAKQHLTDFLGTGRIYVRLLQRDQYGRAVAEVFKRGIMPWQKTYVDEEMLSQGFAEVYQGGGAVYGPKGKDAYLELENEARENKLGIWSKGKRESAAEYKRRTKQ